ncbi:RNA polymerase sigma factor [bacterium]|nr:RNA polymerase sigma factor [bacterium]
MKKNETTDATLVQLAKGGDEQAWRQLVKRYIRKIAGTVHRIYGSHTDSEDVIQEILIALAKSLPNYRGDASFSTYLYRLSINVTYRYIKRHKNRSLVCDAVEWSDDIPENYNQNVLSHIDALAAEEQDELVSRSLRNLSPLKRSALVLFEVENLTLKEIASLFKTPLQTIWSRVTSGKKELLQIYKNSGELS